MQTSDLGCPRTERKRQMLNATKCGIALRLAIIFAEFVGFYYFCSYALLLDAIASSIDIICSLVLIICIRLAARPPDKDHPFGHGRYEPLAGLQLGLLLVLIGGGMLVQQGMQTVAHAEFPPLDPRAWLIPFGATVILEISYRIIRNTAKRQHSTALAAEATHYRIDALTSLFATVALVFAAVMPHWSHTIDHIGAMLIALLMIGLGFNASRKNLDQLMDRVPDPDFFKIVRGAAFSAPGVLGISEIQIQHYGPDAHVDIDIQVDPSLPVQEAHKISHAVRGEIREAWPLVRNVTVHVEPYKE